MATLRADAAFQTLEQSSTPLVRFSNEQVVGTSLQEEFLRRRIDREPLNKLYDAYHQLTDKAELAKAEKAFFATVDSTFRATIKASSDSWWGAMLVLYSYSYANGKAMSLKECLAGKKYLLLDFWASWCKPCRKEIPNIMNLYRKYHAEGFEVVSISADTSAEAWKKALEEEQLPWYNDRDGEQGICNLYKMQYYPTLYLLDAEGKVVAKDLRGEGLAAKLDELFQQK